MVLGASGSIGAENAARAAPDGYTLMLTSSAQMVTRVFLTKNTPYDPVKNFTPIGKVAEAISVIAVHPSLPVHSVRELIDYAKKNSGRLSYGTSGIGTAHHLSAEMIRQLTGIEWTHVPYKGGTPVVTDLVSGQIPVGFAILATIVNFAQAGKVRLIAVSADTRYPAIPEVPTTGEQLPGFEKPPGWMAYFGPAGMPAPIVRRLNAEIVRTMQVPEVKARSEGIGFVPVTSSPEELGEMLRRDLGLTGRLMKAAGIEPE
jgi:tripartite-type tricarboxylate transporter receptor subunit TctC